MVYVENAALNVFLWQICRVLRPNENLGLFRNLYPSCNFDCIYIYPLISISIIKQTIKRIQSMMLLIFSIFSEYI